MQHPKILDSARTALVVIDIQEAFRAAISDFPQVASRAAMIVRGFQILNLPVIVTEQYPKGLGRTAEEILFSLPDDFEFIEKTTFSSCGAAAFLEQIEAAGARQIVICGLETHICVNQTAHDLLAAGFDVHLLTDAVGSRYSTDREAGLAKMFANGAVPATVEMALFELLRGARHDKFREIQNLIK
ncbi:MAG: hydrolase [Acidobacteria bacterium]|nr:hydrolase [Acidobacteriota bacterium]